VIASYRIGRDAWDNPYALSEAKARGMAFFQFPRMSYIQAFRPRTLEAKTGAAGNAVTSTNLTAK
jgi:hypothetical protein